MARTGAAWGIDLGQTALKALRCRPGDQPDRIIAEAFDYIEYPKMLSQPDANPPELIKEALEQFLSRNSVLGDRVAISVSGQSGLARFIKLPPVESKKIPDIVKYEAAAADSVRAGRRGVGLPADGRRQHGGRFRAGDRGGPVRHEARSGEPGAETVYRSGH